MTVLYLILYILAVICFLAVAFRVRTNRVSLLGLGLALAFAVPLIQTWHKV